MTVFDTSVDSAPIQEGNLDPILPEERFVLELIGFERSGPDQFRKDGGFKLTFAVFNQDGSPFEFKDEPYELWRTIDKDRNGQPVFNQNTQAYEWASALLGRTLGVDDKFSASELRNKRMSAMVVWRNKRPPAKGKTFDLASLRHIPVSPVQTQTAPEPKPAPGQVSADPSEDEIDRALSVTKLHRQLDRLDKLDADSGARARAAVAKFDLGTAPMDAIESLLRRVQVSLQAAMDD